MNDMMTKRILAVYGDLYIGRIDIDKLKLQGGDIIECNKSDIEKYIKGLNPIEVKLVGKNIRYNEIVIDDNVQLIIYASGSIVIDGNKKSTISLYNTNDIESFEQFIASSQSIINPPINTAEPYYVMGVGMYNGQWDVKYICQSDKINKWAYGKPIANSMPVSSETKIYQTIDGVNYYNGLRIPIMQFKSYNDASNLKMSGLFFDYLKVRDNDFGVLSQWEGYNHNSTVPYETCKLPHEEYYKHDFNSFNFENAVSETGMFRLQDLAINPYTSGVGGPSSVFDWYVVFIVDNGKRDLENNHPGLKIWHTGKQIKNGGDYIYEDFEPQYFVVPAEIGDYVKCYVALVGSDMGNTTGYGMEVTDDYRKTNYNYLLLNFTNEFEGESLCIVGSIYSKNWIGQRISASIYDLDTYNKQILVDTYLDAYKYKGATPGAIIDSMRFKIDMILVRNGEEIERIYEYFDVYDIENTSPITINVGAYNYSFGASFISGDVFQLSLYECITDWNLIPVVEYVPIYTVQ